MRSVLAALLLLIPAQSDDAPVIVPQIDNAVRGTSGYNAKGEPRTVLDDVFLRRVMKDLVDAAPTDAEIREFATSTNPQKRSRKISDLLADERYGKFWARRFAEAFLGDPARDRWTHLSELPKGREVELAAAFTAWLASRLNKDEAWTQIVRRLLDARGTTEGDPALAFLLSMRRGKGFEREFAERFMRQMLGIRLACARCHDHPYAQWSAEQYYGIAAFVVRQRARVYRDGVEVKYAATGEMKMEAGGLSTGPGFFEGKEVPPLFRFGGKPGEHDDRMEWLADTLTNPSTNQLPRMLVNRTWGWLFGYGIVHPVDDFSLKNKAMSPALLETLTRNVIDNGYSLKQLLRVICNTQAYQMPTPAEAPEAMSFRHLAAKRKDPRLYADLGPKPSALPIAFEVPGGWTWVLPRNPAKALLLIPDRENKARVAELVLVEAKAGGTPGDQETGKLELKKTTSQTLKGKDGTKIVLTETSGTNWCRPEEEGPVDYRIWSAAVDAPKPLLLRVGAAANLLDPWRADFITMLQSLSAK